MTTFVFDVHGTLVNNPTVSDEDARKMLLVLRAAGHRLLIMTGNTLGVPKVLRELVHECHAKPLGPDFFKAGMVVFDDCIPLLRSIERKGVKVVAASQMGEWIANQEWDDGSGRQNATG